MSKLWYDDVRKELTKLGFTHNPKDECVFNKVMDGHQITECIYVNDLFATSIDEADLELIRPALVQRYGDVEKGEFKLSIMDYKVSGYRATPTADGLFALDSESRLPGVEVAAQFHSRVAKLLYVALRCRPDILLAESY
jgi:hypothetical protein